jgi:hypothetical protein
MLGRKLEKFSIFERFHLMDQAAWHIHAFTSLQLKLFDDGRILRLLYPDYQPAGMQVERLCLKFVKVKRTALAFADLKNFAAI